MVLIVFVASWFQYAFYFLNVVGSALATPASLENNATLSPPSLRCLRRTSLLLQVRMCCAAEFV